MRRLSPVYHSIGSFALPRSRHSPFMAPGLQSPRAYPPIWATLLMSSGSAPATQIRLFGAHAVTNQLTRVTLGSRRARRQTSPTRSRPMALASERFTVLEHRANDGSAEGERST